MVHKRNILQEKNSYLSHTIPTSTQCSFEFPRGDLNKPENQIGLNSTPDDAISRYYFPRSNFYGSGAILIEIFSKQYKQFKRSQDIYWCYAAKLPKKPDNFSRARPAHNTTLGKANQVHTKPCKHDSQRNEKISTPQSRRFKSCFIEVWC